MNSGIQYNADLLAGDVYSKANRIRQSRKSYSKPPEVMVKISGHCRNATHIQSHFDYIGRNGQLEVEDELGQVYQDPKELHQMAKQWCSDTASLKRNTRHTTHIVLSMPNGTEPKALKHAAKSFALKVFAKNHQYVFALHTDTDSPHVHLTIKNLGFDGKRLHIKKGQPQIWREQFANELEQLGIAAEATAPIRPWHHSQPHNYHQLHNRNGREEIEL